MTCQAIAGYRGSGGVTRLGSVVFLSRSGSWPRVHLPGVAVAAVAVAGALAVSRVVPGLSPAVVAVAAGAALANLGWLPAWARPGLGFVSRRVLRVAVVLLGLQVALPEVLALGPATLAVVVAATGITFALTPVIGRRLGVPEGTALLVATGVAICGAAAIAAMRACLEGEERDGEAGEALSVVVLYGSAAIVLVPLLASWLGLPARALGVWAGASVHEVAQVAAIGAASGTAVLTVAVTVKLARVVLLAPMVALTAYRRRAGAAGTAASAAPPLPLFVAGFLVMTAVRSLGLVPEPVAQAVPQATGLLLAACLFGLGAGVDVRRLLAGGRVLLLGGVATALISAVALAGAWVFV
ncbi:YeiH family protein [Thermoactinospora rubra]|uniref:YeiH family protein n=1 Tax=Thermoactinospora rubra TaxID=1088767 RepID=UPI000A0FF578|nr:putative sulfate exporter family transporter [Thermoactinospora rubra]